MFIETAIFHNEEGKFVFGWLEIKVENNPIITFLLFVFTHAFVQVSGIDCIYKDPASTKRQSQ